MGSTPVVWWVGFVQEALPHKDPRRSGPMPVMGYVLEKTSRLQSSEGRGFSSAYIRFQLPPKFRPDPTPGPRGGPASPSPNDY